MVNACWWIHYDFLGVDDRPVECVCVCVRSLGPIHVAVDYRHKVVIRLHWTWRWYQNVLFCWLLLVFHFVVLHWVVIEESLAKSERACCKKTKYHRLCTTLFRAALSVVYEWSKPLLSVQERRTCIVYEVRRKNDLARKRRSKTIQFNMFTVYNCEVIRIIYCILFWIKEEYI